MLRSRCALCLFLIPSLACGNEDTGEGLPPGAFTSGPDDDDGFDVGTSEGLGNTVTSGATNPDESGDTGPIELFHEEDILPIWIAACTDSACHDPDSPEAMLDLATDGVYERICDGSHTQTGMPYIDCVGGDPQNSYIFRKLEGSHTDNLNGSGGTMPPDGSLSDADIARVEAWIEAGAMP